MWLQGNDTLMNIILPICIFLIILLTILSIYACIKIVSTDLQLVILGMTAVFLFILGLASIVTSGSQVTKGAIGVIDRVDKFRQICSQHQYLKCLVNSLRPIVIWIGVFAPMNDILTLSIISIVSTVS